jgi:hypothetical protein
VRALAKAVASNTAASALTTFRHTPCLAAKTLIIAMLYPTNVQAWDSVHLFFCIVISFSFF